MHIAASTAAAASYNGSRSRRDQIGQQMSAALVETNRTWRHAHEKIGSVTSILLLSASWLSVARNQAWFVFEVEQTGEALIDFENDITAASAIAPRWTAERPVLLAQECNRSIAALAAADVNFGLVDEAHTA